MAKNTISDLQVLQALPLSLKIKKTKNRLKEWVDRFGEDGTFVAFSGGKDSTVLLDLVRQDFPNVEGLFVDVPTQFPELKAFAKTYPNVTMIHPKLGYMQVVEKYGFPFISKEVAECVQGARKYLTEINKEIALTDRQTDRQNRRIDITTKELRGKDNTVNFQKPLLVM